MFLLFSHVLTSEQLKDAKDSLGVEEFVSLPNELQELWSNVPATLETISDYLQPIRDFLIEELKNDDIVLIHGDFGATCATVSIVNSLGGVAVYATTKRDVVEKEVDGKIIKTSFFEHVRFRRY